jgi:glycosyltransferase involved in cell wall biosynthesis
MTSRASRPPAPGGFPVARWLVLAVLLTGLVVSLAVEGLLGRAETPRALRPPLLTGTSTLGPALSVGETTLRSATGTPGAVGIALVESGSERAWGEAEAVLARHSAGATWFLSGRTVLDHPERLRRARAAGAEIGVTGFSGRDLATLPAWRTRVELSSAQAALASRGGVTSPLLLLPSTPTRDRIDAPALAAARTAASRGYLLVAGTDPREVRPGDVAVVALDPAGLRRLDALLDRLATDGIPAVRVSEVVGIDPAVANPPAGLLARANASVVAAAIRAAGAIAATVDVLFLPLAILMSARAVLAIVLATVHARRRPPPATWTGPVTVVVPAYNEAAGIGDALRSIVASDWPHGLHVIVVDDGSTDGTGDIVEELGLPGVHLLRQANRGKPAALDAGLAAAGTEVVVMVDGDTVFEPTTVARLVTPLADPDVGAVSGNAKVGNRSSLLGRWQHIEYVMGFNLDRRLLATLGAIATVPGAVGAFRMTALQEVGGVSADTIAEDTDLTIAIQRAGWEVTYQDDAIAWTEAPSTAGDLWRQRYRWCYGTLQAVWKHRRAVAERRSIGLVGLPYALTFQVAVALLGPVVDVAALYKLATTQARSVALVWLGFTGAQVLLAVVAFRLDRERMRPLWAVPLQQLAYRQMMYLVVIQSVAAALAGTRLRWHKLRRTGLAGAPSPGYRRDL